MDNAKTIFAQNVDALLKNADSSMKPLVDAADSLGIKVDYSYFTRVRKSKINPSLEKAEIIVQILSSLEGYSDIKLWMFLVPNYFKNGMYASGMTMSANIADQVKFTEELLFAIRTMRVMEISEEQYADILNIASYLSKKTENNQSSGSAKSQKAV